MRRRINSLLFVPSKDKMLAKIPSMNADAYIIDLEDSIPEDEKEDALNRAYSFIGGLKEKSNIIVRVNANLAKQELSKLSSYGEIGFMLPKYEIKNPYDALSEIIRRHYTIALIESPKALVALQDICQVGYLDALAFGAEDFTAKVNMENNVNYLYFHKSMLVTYANAYDLQVFDTPCFKLGDESELVKEVEIAKGLGFDGKMAISPKHIQCINDAFRSSDLEYMKSVVSQYEQDGNAVVVIDGKVFEKMHINRFKKILEEKTK